MASGRLGVADLTAATNTSVYTVPASTVATININIVNRTSTSTTIRLGVSTSASPVSAEWVEYDYYLTANDVIERTGFICAASEQVVVYAAAAGVSVRVHGIEESA